LAGALKTLFEFSEEAFRCKGKARVLKRSKITFLCYGLQPVVDNAKTESRLQSENFLSGLQSKTPNIKLNASTAKLPLCPDRWLSPKGNGSIHSGNPKQIGSRPESLRDNSSVNGVIERVDVFSDPNLF